MATQCPPRARFSLAACAILGLGAFAVGLVHAPDRAWAGLMIGNFLALSVSMGAALFVALNHVFSAGWATLFRRIPEAMAAYLPIGYAVLLATFLLGGHHLYPWLQTDVVQADRHLQHKLAFLNPVLFVVVTLFASLVWIGGTSLLRIRSRAQDADGDIRHTRISRRIAAGFLVLSGLSIIPASFLWLMSLEPLWTSTMYPGYIYAGLLASGCAAIGLFVVLMNRNGLMPGIRESHIYELIRLVGAANTLWAYIWFCQYVLIYYTNIPEEAIYYAVRKSGPFGVLFIANVVLNWLVPTLMMLPDAARRSSAVLLRMCVITLVGRFLDVILLVAPAIASPFRLTVYEVLIPLAFVPAFLLAFRATFRSAKPVPERDPYLIESRGVVL